MSKDLLVRLSADINSGQQDFSATMRRLIQLVRPDLYELLASCNGEPFLEPFAFLYFSKDHSSLGLEQVFAGYLTSAHRPLQVPVFSDHSGHFYVPHLGNFATAMQDSRLDLVAPVSSNAYYVMHNGNDIPYSFEPLTTIGGTLIELCRYPVPLLDRCFVGADGQVVTIDITNVATVHADHLAKALTILQRVWPALHEAIVGVVRLLVVFRADGLNSFATTAAHGTAFLNAALGDDEIFFLEDLAHQCGHVIFSAATVEAAENFVVAPSTPMRVFKEQRTDGRSVYVALHGVFTEALIAKCLDACMTDGIFIGRQHDELQGRLAFILQRFATDLRNFATPGILSLKGEELLHALREVWEDISVRRAQLFTAADMSNQGYNFSYQRYAELNPETGEW